jgi:hypothetical protein
MTFLPCFDAALFPEHSAAINTSAEDLVNSHRSFHVELFATTANPALRSRILEHLAARSALK